MVYRVFLFLVVCLSPIFSLEASAGKFIANDTESGMNFLVPCAENIYNQEQGGCVANSGFIACTQYAPRRGALLDVPEYCHQFEQLGIECPLVQHPADQTSEEHGVEIIPGHIQLIVPQPDSKVVSIDYDNEIDGTIKQIETELLGGTICYPGKLCSASYGELTFGCTSDPENFEQVCYDYTNSSRQYAEVAYSRGLYRQAVAGFYKHIKEELKLQRPEIKIYGPVCKEYARELDREYTKYIELVPRFFNSTNCSNHSETIEARLLALAKLCNPKTSATVTKDPKLRALLPGTQDSPIGSQAACDFLALSSRITGGFFKLVTCEARYRARKLFSEIFAERYDLFHNLLKFEIATCRNVAEKKASHWYDDDQAKGKRVLNSCWQGSEDSRDSAFSAAAPATGPSMMFGCEKDGVPAGREKKYGALEMINDVFYKYFFNLNEALSGSPMHARFGVNTNVEGRTHHKDFCGGMGFDDFDSEKFHLDFRLGTDEEFFKSGRFGRSFWRFRSGEMSDWDDDNFQWRSVGGEFSSCRDTLGLPMLGKDAARCCSGGTFVPNKSEGCPGSIDEDMGKEIDGMGDSLGAISEGIKQLDNLLGGYGTDINMKPEEGSAGMSGLDGISSAATDDVSAVVPNTKTKNEKESTGSKPGGGDETKQNKGASTGGPGAGNSGLGALTLSGNQTDQEKQKGDKIEDQAAETGAVYSARSGLATAGSGSEGARLPDESEVSGVGPGSVEFGATGEDKVLGTPDPEDYFTRINPDESIFKHVERAYGRKNTAWTLEKPGKR